MMMNGFVNSGMLIREATAKVKEMMNEFHNTIAVNLVRQYLSSGDSRCDATEKPREEKLRLDKMIDDALRALTGEEPDRWDGVEKVTEGDLGDFE